MVASVCMYLYNNEVLYSPSLGLYDMYYSVPVAIIHIIRYESVASTMTVRVLTK